MPVLPPTAPTAVNNVFSSSVPNYSQAPNFSRAPAPNTSTPNGPINTPAPSLVSNLFNSPVPKPTSVVGPGPAIKTANNIQSTVNNQNTANTAAQQQLYSASNGFVTPYGLSQGAKPVNPGDPAFAATSGTQNTNTGTGTSQGTNTTVTPPVQTAEDKIANAPDAGMQEAYDLKTGQRSDQPIGAIDTSKYSTQNPLTRTDVNASVSDTNGVQYKQFSDGTYARIDESGNYSLATASSFAAAQAAAGVQSKIQAIQNGTFQLPPNQQAQLDGLSAKYAGLIQQQATENANTTGTTTLAENLYGMGNNLVGQGVITKTVNDGLQKIQQLQFELANGLAVMTDAFQKEDLAQLNTTYNSYENNQKALQTEIDKQVAYIQSETDKQQAVIDNKNMNYALQQAAKYGDAGILPTDTPQEVDAKKQKNSAVYQYELGTKSGAVDQNVIDGMLASYNKTGAIPTFYGASGLPYKKAFWAAIGGNTSLVDNAATNKAAITAASKALDNQQNQYAANQTSVSKIKNSIVIAQNLMNTLGKTGSPFLNKPLQWVQDQLQGNSSYSGLNIALSTVATEYGKIMSGASASIGGTPASIASDTQNKLNIAMTNGQIDSVMSTIQNDINGALSAQKDTIGSLTQDVKDIGSSSSTTAAGGSKTTSTSSSNTTAPAGFGWNPGS